MILTLLGVRWDLSKSDWAAWVQAVGSIAAILVAVGIAHRDTRRRRDDELVVARIAAATFIHAARTLRVRADDAASALENSAILGYPVQEIKHALSFIETANLWTTDDLTKLAPLPNGCAMLLADGQSFLQDGIVLMQAAISRQFQERPYEEVLQSVIPAVSCLRQAAELLDTAVSRMGNLRVIEQ